MIGSFWNLCRACPSMPIDKLHSEYRSTYTWHEYTGSGQQDHNSQAVVRRAPQQQQQHQQQNPKEQEAKLVAAAPVIKPSEDDVAGTGEGPSMEPPLPRRKKYPELAYRTHEFIPAAAADAAGVDCLDSNVVADKVREVAKVLPTSQLSKAITKISTEYRLQFAWPRKQQQALTNGEVNEAGQHPPRKSLSMGVLRQGSLFGGGGPGGAAPIAPVHKKRGQQEINKQQQQQQITGQPAVLAQQQSHQISSSELEPLVGRKQQPPQHLLSNVVEERDEPDQAPVPVNYRKRTTGAGRAVRLVDPDGSQQQQQQQQQQRPFSAAQVVELRRELKRLAEEYKHRDWTGSGEDENAGLWRHVSSSQALEALSLARHQQSPSSKEQKEKENTRKVAVPAAGRPSNEQARPVFQPEDFGPDNDRALARARRDFLFRHHLDRTTGVTLGDGALLPSPTREKLEPVTPRRRDETPVGQQGGQEPPQSARSRPSPKSSPRAARSQSVGPAALKEGRSPKRRPVSCSQANKVDGEKTTERQPRPKTAGRTKIVRIDDGSSTTRRPRRSSSSVATPTTRSASRTRSTAGPVARVTVTRPSIRCNNKKLTAEPVINGQDQQPQQQPPEQPPWMENGQPLVKSPPEPTRVKSPEQMIMRSPEPVNWTVPLDTGKTFTVTQNVLEGEPLTRAHSEARSWGPQSAPPELTGRLQHRLHQQGSGYKSPDSESMSLPSFGATSNGLHKDDSAAGSPMASKDEPIQEQQQQQHASDLLEKARNRFDKFWGKSSPDDQQQQQQQPPPQQ
ncbi:hypothetical protein TKK_0018464 [Trichogramma kaykai]|uniref:Nuclear protein MDM1 n=1 Tax=Trichogramma kaykai TaxID=54128 RepID=A0ABD2VYG1_9HYME